MFFDHDGFLRFLTEVCEHYERSAPTVAAYADDLYRRLGDAPATVLVVEVTAVSALRQDGEWEHPHFAANRIYHLLDRLGRDTAGQAGF